MFGKMKDIRFLFPNTSDKLSKLLKNCQNFLGFLTALTLITLYGLGSAIYIYII